MRSGRTSDRATRVTSSRASRIAAEHDRRVADRLRARRRGLVGDGAGYRGHRPVDHLGRDLIGGLERLRACSGLPTIGTFGSEMSAVRWMYSRCSCLASGEPTPSTWAMPNSVDGSVPATVISRVRSSGSGSSAPPVDDELFHHHQPAGADGAAEALRLGADALVVDPDQSGDGVLGGQQDRHVGGDPVDQRDGVGADLVHLRLAALEHAGDALLDIRRDIGRAVEPTLQLGAAGVEGTDRGLNVATGGRSQHRAVEGVHVANDRGHHFGAVGGALQITCFDRVGVDAQPAEGAGQNQRHQNDRKHLPADRPILQRPSARDVSAGRAPGHRRRSTNPSTSSCWVNVVIAAPPRYRPRVRLFLIERGS